MPDIYSIIEYLQSVSFADFSWKSNSCWCLAWNYTKCYGKNQGGYLHYVSIKGFTISSSVFPNFTIFCKNYTQWLLLTSFVSADVGNQLEVTPNARVADDALMQQCATVHCACKMEAMLTPPLITSYTYTRGSVRFRCATFRRLSCFSRFNVH